jgi:hypothetical protein
LFREPAVLETWESELEERSARPLAITWRSDLQGVSGASPSEVSRLSDNLSDAGNESESMSNGCNNVLIEAQEGAQLGWAVSRMLTSEPDMRTGFILMKLGGNPVIKKSLFHDRSCLAGPPCTSPAHQCSTLLPPHVCPNQDV